MVEEVMILSNGLGRVSWKSLETINVYVFIKE